MLLLSNNTKNGNISTIVILLGRKTLNCPIRMWTISRYRNNLTILTREHRIVSYVLCCLIWMWHEAGLKYAPCCHRQSVPVHDSNVELIKECVQSLCPNVSHSTTTNLVPSKYLHKMYSSHFLCRIYFNDPSTLTVREGFLQEWLQCSSSLKY